MAGLAGAFSNAVIKLDSSPVFVFYAGQVVSGSLSFKLDEPLTFTKIYMEYLGEAIVMWTESEVETVNGVKNHKTIKYQGREEYFNLRQKLAGGTGTSQLPPGTKSFPFKFQIPFTAPSSFKGEQGKVSYTMTAHLVTPEHVHVHDVLTKEFQVVAPFDLNTGSPKIRQPIDLEFEEVYGCDCFCSSAPVTIRVRLPVSGYCPGQVVPVAIQVDNDSSVEITKIIFQILSKTLYRSQQPQSEYIPPETVLATMKKGAVMSKCKRNFTCDLVVPEIIAPFLENCSIIDVGYFFRITIKLSGCNDELQDEAELCLGLIPLREFTQGEYVHPLAHSLPVGPLPNPNSPPELIVPPITDVRGSHTSLHEAHYSPAQAGLNQNNPPPYPYPSGNRGYPTENKFQTSVSMEMKPRPFQDYDIGFKAPEVASGYPTNPPGYPTSTPGYPTSTPGYPTSTPGYPTSTPGYPTAMNPPPYVMPSVARPPYPTGNMMPTVNSGIPPYPQGGVGPSAPPPN